MNNEKFYGYAIFKLNNADFTLKYGSYDLSLFKPPIDLRKRLARNQLGNQTIGISLAMPEDKNEDDLEDDFQKKL